MAGCCCAVFRGDRAKKGERKREIGRQEGVVQRWAELGNIKTGRLKQDDLIR